MVRGNERIGWTDIDRLHVTEAYSEERDVEWLEGNGDLFLLSEGAFVILFPQDAHMPQIAVDGPAEVRKVVVKVAI
jgi:YhcH/YjgK/YiaL family protein